MSLHTALFCVELRFENNGTFHPVPKHFRDDQTLRLWVKNFAGLQQRVGNNCGGYGLTHKRKWTHRIVIAIEFIQQCPESLNFVGHGLTRSLCSIHTHTLLCEHTPEVSVAHIGNSLTWMRKHDCKACQAIVLQAQIEDTIDTPLTLFVWRTELYEKHRLSISVIRSSELRFLFLNNNLDQYAKHARDYKAIPLAILKTFSAKLMDNLRNLPSPVFADGINTPTIHQQFERNIHLRRSCGNFISLIGWLKGLNLHVLACSRDSRALLDREASALKAGLEDAMREFDHLNQVLQLELVGQLQQLQQFLQQPPSQEPPPQQSLPQHPDPCDHCVHTERVAHTSFGLVACALIAILFVSRLSMTHIIMMLTTALALYLPLHQQTDSSTLSFSPTAHAIAALLILILTILTTLHPHLFTPQTTTILTATLTTSLAIYLLFRTRQPHPPTRSELICNTIATFIAEVRGMAAQGLGYLSQHLQP